jgi:hypothetical protein
MEAQIRADGTLVVKPATETECWALANWALTEHKIGLVTAEDNVILVGDADPQVTEDEAVAGDNDSVQGATEVALRQQEKKIVGKSTTTETVEDTVVGEPMTKGDIVAKLDLMDKVEDKYSMRMGLDKLKAIYLKAVGLPGKHVVSDEPDATPEEAKTALMTWLDTQGIKDQPAYEAAGIAKMKEYGANKLSEFTTENRNKFVKEVTELTCKS